MFKKNKKTELDEKTKAELIKEFGTYDKNEIEKIIKKLDQYYVHLRYDNINYIYSDDFIKKNSINIIKMLVQRCRFIAIERATLKLDRNTLSPTEMMLIKLDNNIMEKQLLNYGYSKEDALQVIDNIRKKYQVTNSNLISIDIDCYKIDRKRNATILPTKERYKIAKKKFKVLENTL